jgi:hypothetical protein
MNDNERRTYGMFVREQQFFSTRAADFPTGSIGRQLITDLGATIDALDGHTAAESSSGSSARQGTVSRSEARAALREDLEAINRTARTMENEPGLHEKFRLPSRDNDQVLLSAARAFLADALPLKAEFIAHEMPADFLEDLQADIERMEEAISDQSGGLGNRAGAVAAIDEAIENGRTITRKLDAIVHNKYGNSSATMAEWASASHIERAPKRRAGTAVPTPGSPGSPPPPPAGA